MTHISLEALSYAATAGIACATALIMILGGAAIIAAILLWCIDELPYLLYKARKWAAGKWRG